MYLSSPRHTAFVSYLLGLLYIFAKMHNSKGQIAPEGRRDPYLTHYELYFTLSMIMRNNHTMAIRGKSVPVRQVRIMMISSNILFFPAL